MTKSSKITSALSAVAVAKLTCKIAKLLFYVAARFDLRPVSLDHPQSFLLAPSYVSLSVNAIDQILTKLVFVLHAKRRVGGTHSASLINDRLQQIPQLSEHPTGSVL